MNAPPQNTAASPEQVSDLQRQLAERQVDLHEALQRETATAEVLQVITTAI